MQQRASSTATAEPPTRTNSQVGTGTAVRTTTADTVSPSLWVMLILSFLLAGGTFAWRSGLLPSASDLWSWLTSVPSRVGTFIESLDPNTNLNRIFLDTIPAFIAWIGGVALAGLGMGFGWTRKKLRDARAERDAIIDKVIDGPERYVKPMDEAIAAALSEGEDKAFMNARVIVSVRDSISDTVHGIGRNLNSEIDALSETCSDSTVLRNYLSMPKYKRSRHQRDVYDLIVALSKTWPARRTAIVNGIRQILKDAGLATAA